MRARRRALSRLGQGRLLDLGGADMHGALWDRANQVTTATVLDGVGDPRLASLAAGGERFDTVFSVFQLAASNDLGATLHAIGQLLSDDGRLLFLEPGAQVGLPGRMQRLVASPLGGLTGWRADRDIPSGLRAAGLSVTDIARRRVPTVQLWLRQVIEGTAHHALPPAGGRTEAPAEPA